MAKGDSDDQVISLNLIKKDKQCTVSGLGSFIKKKLILIKC